MTGTKVHLRMAGKCLRFDMLRHQVGPANPFVALGPALRCQRAQETPCKICLELPVAVSGRNHGSGESAAMFRSHLPTILSIVILLQPVDTLKLSLAPRCRRRGVFMANFQIDPF